jgi:hypothetical protein
VMRTLARCVVRNVVEALLDWVDWTGISTILLLIVALGLVWLWPGGRD